MPNNTRERSEFLQALAAEIATREGIDVNNPPLDKRKYIQEIAERGQCHIETARTVFNRYLGHARWGNWGGARPGSGLKPGQSPAVNLQKKKSE
jgi:hypothetical protein